MISSHHHVSHANAKAPRKLNLPTPHANGPVRKPWEHDPFALSTTMEAIIEHACGSERNQQAAKELQERDLSLGLRPIPTGDPTDTHVPIKCCDYCHKAANEHVKLMQCSRCLMVSYCSLECQKSHWTESHKKICPSLSKEKDIEAQRIVAEMHYRPGDHLNSVVVSIQTLHTDEGVYAMAVKHGLFPAMEALFQFETAGGMENVDEVLRMYSCSWTQNLTTTIFKGNREVVERFTCVCPYRAKEYIISSRSAWDSLFDASLYLARYLLRDEFSSARSRRDVDIVQKLALAHRAARDVLVSLNLALIHKPVAKAIYFGSKRGAFHRSKEEAIDYAMNMCARLENMFHNEGDGFAPEEVDHNKTIEANVFQFTAMLEYWFRTLEVNPEDPDLFKRGLQLSQLQEIMYETLAVPLAEGTIELGRTLTLEETKQRSLAASREFEQRRRAKAVALRGAKRATKKGGRGNKRR